MAGPGGGPPRKSHTKSRKGCRICKKRHIRCDETFPQCRNCTKHSVRCDYMDMPAAGEELPKGSQSPDLLMSPEMQRMLDNWRLTGEPPLPELAVDDSSYWKHFSAIDLRLIHHITTLSVGLHHRGYAACTPWGPKMLTLINVALTSNFVMSAVLALSASHLAWQTKNADTQSLAYYHRGIALKGLHEAIGDFSEDSSEAILAASMLLSWQATEWRSWASLQQGLSAIMNVMRPWVHKSDLASYLEGQRSIARARTPSTPSISGPPPSIPPEDIRRLDQISTALHNLRLRLSHHDDLLVHVDNLLSYLRQLQQDFPLQAPEEAFERLQPLRSLLLWLPPSLLPAENSDLGAIATLAHCFALALVLEPLFPDIGGAYLGNMSVVPIEYMQDMLLTRRNSIPQDASIQVALSLIEVPVQIATAYKAARRRTMPQELYLHSPHSPFGIPHPQLASTPDLPPTSIYSPSPMQSPRGLQLQGTSYFPATAGSINLRRGSSTNRSVSDRALSAASPLSKISYTPQDSSDWKSPMPSEGEIDYFGNASYVNQSLFQSQLQPMSQSFSQAHSNSANTNRDVMAMRETNFDPSASTAQTGMTAPVMISSAPILPYPSTRQPHTGSDGIERRSTR